VEWGCRCKPEQCADDVHPAIGHLEFAPLQIPFDGGGEGRRALDLAPQRFKFRRNSLQAMHRPVGCISRPDNSSRTSGVPRIVQAKLPEFTIFSIDTALSPPLHRRGIHQRGKKRVYGNAGWISALGEVSYSLTSFN